jgi:regulator of chromosome condensation
MPPKRAAAAKAATKVKADIEPKVNGITPTTTKAATKKAASKPSKAVPAAANTSKKRKADEPEEPVVNGMKRLRTESAEPAEPAPKRSKAAPKKATPTKKMTAAKKPANAKAKTVINSAPTQLLNVYVFGDGSNGELGLGNAKGQLEVKRPRLNPLLDADKVGVVHLAVGGMHTAVLTHDNKILTWGVNDQGALGRDTAWEGGLRDIDDDKSDASSDSGSDTGVNPHESTPGQIDLTDVPAGTVWTQLAATDSATFALTDEGHVYGWGTFRVSHISSVFINNTNIF